jgi:hypothetical protein
MTPKPLYSRRGAGTGSNIIRVDSASQWASPFTIGCQEGMWFVKTNGMPTGYYMGSSELAVSEAMRLYEAYVREQLWLVPDWLDPLLSADYLADGWAGDGPASVLCKILAEGK